MKTDELHELLASARQWLTEDFPKGYSILLSAEEARFFASREVCLQEKLLAPTPRPCHLTSPAAAKQILEIKKQDLQVKIEETRPPVLPAVKQQPLSAEQTAEKELPNPINSSPVLPQATTASSELKKEIAQRGNSSQIELVPPEPKTPVDFSEMMKLIKSLQPTLHILETPPEPQHVLSNTRDKGIQSFRDAEVLILSFSETPKQLLFLHDLARTLGFHGIGGMVISAETMEQKDHWAEWVQSGKRRFLLSSDYGIYTLPKLMAWIKQLPGSNPCLAGNIPLLLISDIAIYIKEPKLKAALWKTLAEYIQNMPASS